MRSIALVLDNVRISYENKLLFEALDEIYKDDKNSSINLFVKNLSWPYKHIEYGVFKLTDYQNFEGNTITMNLELLDFCKKIPNNNKIVPYFSYFPFHENIPGIIPIKLLTHPDFVVYCNNGDVEGFIKTFECQTKVCNIKEAIKENLYV